MGSDLLEGSQDKPHKDTDVIETDTQIHAS
jgi:hypothetical protein